MSRFKNVNGVKVFFTPEENAEQDAVDAQAILNELPNLRKGTSVEKKDFCLALSKIGLLTFDETIAISKGEWPAPMVDFLGYLTSVQSLDVQVEWAGTTSVHRMHPFVLTLGSFLGLTDTQVDSLFGIGEIIPIPPPVEEDPPV